MLVKSKLRTGKKKTDINYLRKVKLNTACSFQLPNNQIIQNKTHHANFHLQQERKEPAELK